MGSTIYVRYLCILVKDRSDTSRTTFKFKNPGQLMLWDSFLVLPSFSLLLKLEIDVAVLQIQCSLTLKV